MIFKQYYNAHKSLVDEYAKKFEISPFVMEIILSRIGDDEEKIKEFLHPQTNLDPFKLNGVNEFCERIKLAKAMGDRVLVFGDYDVDGVSATAIMLKMLKDVGIEANYYLPNRYVDGYGLTNEVIDKICDKYNPNLIITVDCGISCHDEVEYAKEKGVEVIVTDHHELPLEIPETLVINAKIKGQEFGFDGLCGAGLAYKISEAVLGEKKAEYLLPIAAIATIADIVPLVSENRRIVTKGLKLFERYLPLGLKGLFKQNKVSISSPSSNAISFKIAPKLNASGRMGDASDSLKLYFETNPAKIEKLLEKIAEHNSRRQSLCNKIYDEAIKALERIDLKSTRVIVLASKKWDQGVLGIVCSRIVEKYHRPTILFSQENDILHGSGRSIDDINIHELLSSMSDILITYGGHSMAAGVSIKRCDYEEFCRRVNAFALTSINDEVFIPIKYYDKEINLSDINENLLNELKILEPCGCANPIPKFKLSVSDIEILPMKRSPEHAEIKAGDFSLVMFNYVSVAKALTFCRQKNFIFEFQENGKGIVEDFDGGSFISPDANSYVFPYEVEQLKYDKTSDVRYTLYSNPLEFVATAATSVFGTAFVAFSGYDYVNFAKTYSSQGIYYYGICDRYGSGYNSLLLSPEGVEWSKNFSKIIFLTPVLEEGYIEKIAEVSNAEIYLPLSKQNKLTRYSGLDLSRSTFGKIYSLLLSRQYIAYSSIFDLYEKVYKGRGYKFLDFFVAIKVFEELSLIKLSEEGALRFTLESSLKRALTESKIYNKLSLIKNMFKEEK